MSKTTQRDRPHTNIPTSSSMVTMTYTMEEIWKHTQPMVVPSKKKYNRKVKHKQNG